MTGTFAVGAALSTVGRDGGSARTISTGISFEDALQAADYSASRVFGFNELGLFGRHGAVPAPLLAPSSPPSSDTAAVLHQAGVGGGIADADPAAPASQAGIGGEAITSGLLEKPIAAGNREPAALTASDASSLLGSAGTDCGPAASDDRALAEATEATPPRGLAGRQLALPAGTSPVRLTLWMDGSRALLVARDFTLSEEDRAELEERARDILESHDLGLEGITLNGIRAAVPPVREQG